MTKGLFEGVLKFRILIATVGFRASLLFIFWRVWRMISNSQGVEATKTKSPFKTKISIVMPVYEVDARLLNECIQSVLSQTYINWELCICSDISVALEVRNVLKKYRGIDDRIRVVFLSEPESICVVSNIAAEQATGTFIAYLRCFEVLDLNLIGAIADALSKHPEKDFLCLDDSSLKLNFKPISEYGGLLASKQSPRLQVIRKKIFWNMNGFSEGCGK